MVHLTLRDAVFVAISYSDIFSYVLTIEELIRFLPYRSDVSKEQILRVARTLHIVIRDGFVSFSQASKHISLRKKRDAIAQNKWKIVYSVLWIFRYIPTVRLVGVTGALSMNNVEEKDDIDLLVVCKGKSVWTTRFIVTVVFDVLGIRRKPYTREVSDLFCLNMYLSSDALEIPKDRRNFYVAHEIVQMVPVFDRNNTYDSFIRKNIWVKNFLPHGLSKTRKMTILSDESKNFFANLCSCSVTALFQAFDIFFMHMQRVYMESRRTREVVERESILFHPIDANDWVYRELAVRLRRRKIPLDKFFFSR